MQSCVFLLIFRWLSAELSLSRSYHCVQSLSLCLYTGVTTLHRGTIPIATVLHSATDLYLILLLHLLIQRVFSFDFFKIYLFLFDSTQRAKALNWAKKQKNIIRSSQYFQKCFLIIIVIVFFFFLYFYCNVIPNFIAFKVIRTANH